MHRVYLFHGDLDVRRVAGRKRSTRVHRLLRARHGLHLRRRGGRKGDAEPIAEMHRLIAKDKRNAERILPYIGGEEVNTSPTHAHHRYVIDFGDSPLGRRDLTSYDLERWPREGARGMANGPASSRRTTLAR